MNAGRIDFLGCPLDLIHHRDLLLRAETALRGGERLRIEGLNVAKLVDARRDVALESALRQAELIHVDGAGISLGLSLMGIPAPPRRAGIDLMLDLCRLAAETGVGVFLLGARLGVAEAAGRRLTEAVPGLAVVGTRDGYFDDRQAQDVVETIRRSGAGLLFIGISSPRKEVFLNTYWGDMGVALGMGVGGAFDVFAGRLRRAPVWMRRSGLEWLFRLIQEPRRLAGRYGRTNLAYLGLLVRALSRRNPRIE